MVSFFMFCGDFVIIFENKYPRIKESMLENDLPRENIEKQSKILKKYEYILYIYIYIYIYMCHGSRIYIYMYIHTICEVCLN